jgi:hypothetical protein
VASVDLELPGEQQAAVNLGMQSKSAVRSVPYYDIVKDACKWLAASLELELPALCRQPCLATSIPGPPLLAAA